jgi:uncharacterized Zn finger protein
MAEGAEPVKGRCVYCRENTLKQVMEGGRPVFKCEKCGRVTPLPS